jgi:hypothetical protein
VNEPFGSHNKTRRRKKQTKKRPSLFPVIASSFQNIREREKKVDMAKERKQNINSIVIHIGSAKNNRKKAYFGD